MMMVVEGGHGVHLRSLLKSELLVGLNIFGHSNLYLVF